MGCRFVAFLAITTLIMLDLLSISAIPNVYLSSRFRQKRYAEEDVPVHKRSLKKSDTFSDFNTVFSTIDNEKTDKFLSFTSDPDTRIKFKFTKFDVLDGREEYVSVYNGIPDEVINMKTLNKREKRGIQQTIQLNSNINLKSRSKRMIGKTTRTEDPLTGWADTTILNSITNLPFLMSSKPAVDNHDTSNIVLNHDYISDTNELTLHFINEPYDSDIFDKVKATISVTTKNGDGNNWDVGLINKEGEKGARKRNIELNDDTQKVTDTKVSFPVCCLGNVNHKTCGGNNNIERSFTGSGGTISSHPGYSDNNLDMEKTEVCKVHLKSEHKNQNLRFTITTMQLADEDVNTNCKDVDDAYLQFTDVKNNKTESLCYVNSKREFEFGHEVLLELHTGSWGALKGFEILYAAVASKEDGDSKIAQITEDEQDSNSDDQNEDAIESANLLTNSKFATTSIVVGIVLLIVVLIVCGLTFKKSQEQDTIINELQQKLEKLKNEPLDQTNLLNSESSIITIEIDDSYQKPSLTKLAVPTCRSKTLNFADETDRLITNSSEDEKCLPDVNLVGNVKQ